MRLLTAGARLVLSRRLARGRRSRGCRRRSRLVRLLRGLIGSMFGTGVWSCGRVWCRGMKLRRILGRHDGWTFLGSCWHQQPVPSDAAVHALLKISIEFPYALRHWWRTSARTLRLQGCEQPVAALVEALRKAHQKPAGRSRHAWHRDAAAPLLEAAWHGASRVGNWLGRGDACSEFLHCQKLAPARLKLPQRPFPSRGDCAQ